MNDINCDSLLKILHLALKKERSKCTKSKKSNFFSVQYDNLKVTRCSTLKDKPTDIGNIEFGSAFTDHMLTIQWSLRNGWEDPEIKPYGNISLSPAAKVLHYAVEVITCYICLTICSCSRSKRRTING